MKKLNMVPDIDYGELRFPISAWQMQVVLGGMAHEEANGRSKDWLDSGGMDQFLPDKIVILARVE